MAREQRLQLRQRRAGESGHHQFAGLVAHDAGQGPHVQRLASMLRRARAMVVFGASAADAHGAAAVCAVAHAVDDLAKGCVHPAMVLPCPFGRPWRRFDFFERAA